MISHPQSRWPLEYSCIVAPTRLENLCVDQKPQPEPLQNVKDHPFDTVQEA
jgi:hypothetical protein